ncbi:MAG: helix-turn-helix domain-containing protein [Anaerolineaceae bacterium]
MEKREVWALMQSLSHYLMSQYETPMENSAASVGITPLECFAVILPAHMFEPDPISAERLRKRTPYNSLSYYQKPLLSVYAAGYLDMVPEGGYRLNDKGHHAYIEVMKIAYQTLEEINSFPQDKCKELKTILGKLVQACILSTDQPNKWSLLHSRRLDPGHEVTAIISIDQYISDLVAYRDDAHTASWSGYIINPLAWDILGLLWRGLTSTIEEIILKTNKRGWTEQETANAIEELNSKGWIEGFSLSQKGISIREKAERMTDQYFFSPWDRLSNEDYQLLCQLFIQFQKITQ